MSRFPQGCTRVDTVDMGVAASSEQATWPVSVSRDALSDCYGAS